MFPPSLDHWSVLANLLKIVTLTKFDMTTNILRPAFIDIKDASAYTIIESTNAKWKKRIHQ